MLVAPASMHAQGTRQKLKKENQELRKELQEIKDTIKKMKEDR